MEATVEKHYIQTIATLLALLNYAEPKDEKALFLSIHAARALADSFAILATAVDSNATLQKVLEERANLSICGVAKMLGIYQGEPAGIPDQQWFDRVKSAPQRSTDAGQWFSPN